MTFTFTNFQPSGPDEYAFKNIIPRILQSYSQAKQAQYLGLGLEEALKKAMLYNKYYGPEKESQIGLRGAQTGYYNAETQGKNITNQYLPQKYKEELRSEKFKTDNPLLGLTGNASQIGALIYLRQHPELAMQQGQQGQQGQQINNEGFQKNIQQEQNGNPANLLLQSIQKSMMGNSKASLSPGAKSANDYEDIKQGYYPGTGRNRTFENEETAKRYLQSFEKVQNSNNWKTTPVNAKNYILAQAAGAGINPDEAIKKLSSGKSINDLLTEKGFDPENPPDPDYLPTTGNTTLLKNRQAALKELNVISNFVTKGLGPYSRIILGFSPSQIVDAAKEKNEDKQIDFYAARALVPELANLRLATASAKNTVSGIKSIIDKSLSNISVIRPLISEKIWEKTQDKVDSILREGLNASIKSYNVGNKNNKISKAIKNNNEEVIDYIRDSSGKIVRAK